MRTTLRASAVLLALAFSWPVSAGGDVESRDLIGSIRYKTFTFEQGTPARRAAAQERILAVVEQQLRAKGVIRVFGEAELHVVTHVLVDRHRLEDVERKDYFDYWKGVDSVDAFDVRGGTIVVDLIDVTQKRTVWRGVASAAVKGPPAKVYARIDKLLEKLFKGFPEQ